jgi:hypothetical protein
VYRPVVPVYTRFLDRSISAFQSISRNSESHVESVQPIKCMIFILICNNKIYSNLAYIYMYFGPQRLGPHRQRSSFVQVCRLNALHVTFTIPRNRLECGYRPVQKPCIDWYYWSIHRYLFVYTVKFLFN